MPYTKSPDELADAIAAMTFGDLMSVASDLSQMAEAKDARPKLETPEEFASLLWDWSESNREAAAAEAAERKANSQ